MAIFQLPDDYVESFTLTTNPKVFFASSSSGHTGSLYYFTERSISEKDVNVQKDASYFVDNTAETSLETAKLKSRTTNDISVEIEKYVTDVNARSTSENKQQTFHIKRVVPRFEDDTTQYYLSTIKNLNNYYRPQSNSYNWAYTNWHCLSFPFVSDGEDEVDTGSTDGQFFESATDAAILYPNGEDTLSSGELYTPTGPFTFDFCINPRVNAKRYPTPVTGSKFYDGLLLGSTVQATSNVKFDNACVMHMSSSFAIYLASGSLKDASGYPRGYKMIIALSHSADYSPDKWPSDLPGVYPYDLIFSSSDNSLLHDHWHRVQIRWGTETVNNGVGSFFIDGVENNTFSIPSASIGTVLPGNAVLSIGGFVEAGTGDLRNWFCQNQIAIQDNVVLDPNASAYVPSGQFLIKSRFKGDLHDIMIRHSYVRDLSVYPQLENKLPTDVKFYLQPFFRRESNDWKSNGDPAYGSLCRSWHELLNSDAAIQTNTPFNYQLFNSVEGWSINVQNFLMDLVTGHLPMTRQYGDYQCTLAGGYSVNDDTSGIDYMIQTDGYSDYRITSTEILWNRNRNCLIMPCDDGQNVPNFTLLTSKSVDLSWYVDDIDVTNNSLISLNNIYDATWVDKRDTDQSVPGGMFDQLVGPSPIRNKRSWTYTQYYALTQKYRSSESHMFVLFDLTNMYYGLRINPGSLTIYNAGIHGFTNASSNKHQYCKMTLKDDGKGNLYRADCSTKQATWNSVGNVYYNEGLIVIKSPHLYFFGSSNYVIEFEGEQNIHTMKFNLFAYPQSLLSSSNPTFDTTLSASNLAWERDDPEKFVMISDINIHDDNLNVIAKATLAQPILKRESDKYLFVVKFDF